MTDHRCGLPSPEAKKTKSSSRFSVSNMMASLGPRDAVGPHANNSVQMGSQYGKTRVFMALRLRREASCAQGVVRRRRPPLRAAQSEILRVLPPRPGNSRQPKALRGNRFRRARAADQYLQKSARKQTAKESRWEERVGRFGPCVQIPRQVERCTVLGPRPQG